jgi:hypothetical protein
MGNAELWPLYTPKSSDGDEKHAIPYPHGHMREYRVTLMMKESI